MKTPEINSKEQPFPETRPEIEITPLDAEPFAIDCRELRYWGIIPEIGQRSFMAKYDGRCDLKRVEAFHAVRKAQVHKVEGVEIELEEWLCEEGWRRTEVHCYGRVLEDKSQWLALIDSSSNETVVKTFMDESFLLVYPDNPRLLSDGDLFKIQPDGSLKTTRALDEIFTDSGTGYFSVRIGGRSFDCLRVVGIEGKVVDEDTYIDEVYFTDAGRMALMRRYCTAKSALSYGDTTNENLIITVDGHTYMHFRDTLTDTACGIDPG